MPLPFSAFLRNPRRATARLRSIVDARIVGAVLTRPRKGNIALFHLGRSGSTVLGDLLDQHQQVFWDQEIYRSLEDKAPLLPEGYNQALAGKALELLRCRMGRVGKEFYGFETKFFQLRLTQADLEDYLTGLRQLGITHFIILERKNYLRKVVSSLVYHARKSSHQASSKRAHMTKVNMDVNDIRIDKDAKPLLEYLLDWKESFAALREYLKNDNVLSLTYESDISNSPVIAYERVCAFLAIPPRKVFVRYGKTNPFKLSEIIENFSQVEQYLSGTPFDWMLERD